MIGFEAAQELRSRLVATQLRRVRLVTTIAATSSMQAVSNSPLRPQWSPLIARAFPLLSRDYSVDLHPARCREWFAMVLLSPS
jgi:hypothetical protein